MEGLSTILAAVRQHGADVKAYRDLGAIVARLHPNGELLIFNYTAVATFRRDWTPVERICRGLIIHWPTASVVALPFPKFFNLNEQPETRLEALPTGPVEVTAKLDGSLGITFWEGTRFAVATRGSFTGVQAEWATARLHAAHLVADLPRDVTLLFEIIYPRNRVVINYGATEGLFLIGARSLSDGRDLNHAELATLAKRYDFPLVPIEDVPHLAALVPLAERATGIEGWVVRFPNGLRVKIKTAEYLRFHRLVTGLTPARVRELLADDPAKFDSFLMDLPDEFQGEARALATAILAEVDAHAARLSAVFAGPLAAAAAESRKTFAQLVLSQHQADAKYLFALLDGRDIRPLLLADVDLATLPLPASETSGFWARQQRAIAGL
ncbi:MAG: T4 RnlA family RNA ligase [Ktedonobacterales bacterium]|nr:T4 RnlA family RNA ligase [Ktedonobacterales bacterium]